jgi:hypothetical protein
MGLTCISSGSSGEDSLSSGQTSATAAREATKSIEDAYAPVCDLESGAACEVAPGCIGRQYRAAHYVRQTKAAAPAGTSPGSWTYVGAVCLSSGMAPRTDASGGPQPAPLPVVTWQIVLREMQRIGLPSLQVRVQPAERTLVNFATNFYAEPEAFERQITLLGQDVDVRAEPTRFDWTFGDGANRQTEGAGGPYPDLDITHRYTDADVTVSPSVDVTYAAEFRVGDGEWQQIPETVTIGGTPVSLRIVEATPVLTGAGQDP